LGAVIGLDVGGTGIRAGLVLDGCLREEGRASLSDRSVESVLCLAQQLVEALPPAEAVGVALPGFVSHGRIQSSPNFPGWSQVPFSQLLQSRLAIPVRVENDASAAAWGAYQEGGCQKDLVLFTLGTGVGGGIVTGGQLLRGHGGCGAELGHLYVGGEAACGCGAVGCLEAWASASGLIRLAAEQGVFLKDGRALWAACDASEDWALDLAKAAGTALGRGMASIANAVNPEQILLTGGLTAGQVHLEGPMNAAFKCHCISTAQEAVEVVWAGRAENFAILGAASLADR
jgi:glucokinase